MTKRDKHAKLQELALAGDNSAKHKLWTDIAMYLKKTLLSAGYRPDDYLGEAYIAFATYLQAWDPNKGKLEMYMSFRLRNRMFHVMRREAIVNLPVKDYQAGVRTRACQFEEDPNIYSE